MDELTRRDIAALRAANPGPLTLAGTNSYLIGRDPAWCVDPGPLLDAHVDALVGEVERRGGLGGIALTHSHLDHTEATEALRARTSEPPVAAANRGADVVLADGVTFGPLRAIATPGHSPDHVALLAADVAFTGDAVLGGSSVFIAPDPGALAGYLAGLERLLAEQPELLCPGHGPVIVDAAAALRSYIEHRLERERLLVEALARGERSVAGLLDAAWSDVPATLRPAATLSLAAHLDKLDAEGRLPADVERPAV